MTAGGELEEVERADVGGLDTRDVAEGLDQAVVLVVDDEGAAALAELAVAGLATAGADLAAGDDLGDVGVGLEGLERGDGLLGLLDRLELGRDDQGDLGDAVDAVSAGEDERRDGRSGDSRNRSETLLVLTNLYMPLPPDLGRGKHATAAAHVAESGLTGAVRSSSSDTRDTRDGTTGTPGLGRSLVSSILGNTVRLAAIFGDRFVDLSDNVRADRSGEDSRERERGRRLSLKGANLHSRTSGHCCLSRGDNAGAR